jgi:hypothetical protein
MEKKWRFHIFPQEHGKQKIKQFQFQSLSRLPIETSWCKDNGNQMIKNLTLLTARSGDTADE